MLCFAYAKIKMTSCLSPEQYLAKLASVVQPPKPYEGATIPQPDNDKMIFVGKITDVGFSVNRLLGWHKGGRRAPAARILGTLRQSSIGTDILIKIMPSVEAVIGGSIAFLFWGLAATDFDPLPKHGVIHLSSCWAIYAGFLLLIYLSLLVAPVRDEAQAIRKTLAQVIEDQPVKVMMV